VVDVGELECVGQGETDEACADYDDSQGSLRRLVLLRHFVLWSLGLTTCVWKLGVYDLGIFKLTVCALPRWAIRHPPYVPKHCICTCVVSAAQCHTH
jgi:hypothetical protein